MKQVIYTCLRYQLPTVEDDVDRGLQPAVLNWKQLRTISTTAQLLTCLLSHYF